MRRLFSDIEPKNFAEAQGVKCYPEFRVDDPSTYGELLADALAYVGKNPCINGYACWIPEAGIVRVNPYKMMAAIA